jgi:hypothetical protein
VDARDGVVHRGLGQRRRPERVLIGRKLDDRAGIESQLARDVLDRLARLVRHEIEQLAVGYVPNGEHLLSLPQEGPNVETARRNSAGGKFQQENMNLMKDMKGN